MADEAKTEFAPPRRASQEAVQSQAGLILKQKLLEQLFGAVSEAVVILNEQRQIVFFNERFTELIGGAGPNSTLGLRPGEALACVNANRCAGGCGTSEFCVTCGAVNAILTSLSGQRGVSECSILRGPDGADAMDLLVRASPLEMDGQKLSIVALMDISHEKRRRNLERVFFHDVMNTVAGVRLFSELLAKAKPDRASQLTKDLARCVARLTEELNAQRSLMSAEHNELPVRPSDIGSRSLIEELVGHYPQYESLRGCNLTLADDAEEVRFQTDNIILSRVLVNMIKNAIEASKPGQTVAVSCRRRDDRVEFSVHNEGAMTREVQLQLFHRSFSTKGSSRGLGTYSMKLLTERYLGGRITFASSEEQGTTFTASYPLQIT